MKDTKLQSSPINPMPVRNWLLRLFVHTHRVFPTTIVDATFASECSEGIGTLMGDELSAAPCTNPAHNTNTLDTGNVWCCCCDMV